jgi:hypothetical protein
MSATFSRDLSIRRASTGTGRRPRNRSQAPPWRSATRGCRLAGRGLSKGGRSTRTWCRATRRSLRSQTPFHGYLARAKGLGESVPDVDEDADLKGGEALDIVHETAEDIFPGIRQPADR